MNVFIYFQVLFILLLFLGNVDITPAVVARRKELLPNMSEVIFMELAHNENVDDCIGTLPCSIYEQVDVGSTQLNE